MEYKIQEIEGSFNGEIVENLGNNEYVIKLNDIEQNLKILTMDSKGIEFVLEEKYHKVKYIESCTAKMNVIGDGVPMTLIRYANLNESVYKNGGGGGVSDSEIALKSKISGKVFAIAVVEGAGDKKGEATCS